MWRFLLNGATALSLLLGVSACALWVRSHYTGDSLAYTALDRRTLRCDEFTLESELGVIHVIRTRWTFDTPAVFQRALDRRPDILGWRYTSVATYTFASSNDGTLARLGFARSIPRRAQALVSGRPAGSMTHDWIAFPHWSLALLLILPLSRAATLLHRRLRTKSNPTSCAHCGYDLRATPDRCPECGATPAVPRDNPTLAAQYTPPCDSPPPSS